MIAHTTRIIPVCLLGILLWLVVTIIMVFIRVLSALMWFLVRPLPVVTLGLALYTWSSERSEHNSLSFSHRRQLDWQANWRIDINFILLSSLPNMKINWLDTVKVEWSDWKIYDRQPCLIFWRVMGYLAPTINFNQWKRSERYSRRRFTQEKAENSDFIRKRSTQDA